MEPPARGSRRSRSGSAHSRSRSRSKSRSRSRARRGKSSPSRKRKTAKRDSSSSSSPRARKERKDAFGRSVAARQKYGDRSSSREAGRRRRSASREHNVADGSRGISGKGAKLAGCGMGMYPQMWMGGKGMFNPWQGLPAEGAPTDEGAAAIGGYNPSSMFPPMWGFPGLPPPEGGWPGLPPLEGGWPGLPPPEAGWPGLPPPESGRSQDWNRPYGEREDEADRRKGRRSRSARRSRGTSQSRDRSRDRPGRSRDRRDDQRGKSADVVRLPRHLMGRVIGKQGVTINKIRESTGARVDAEDRNEEQCEFKISGTPDAVQRAKAMISEIAERSAAGAEAGRAGGPDDADGISGAMSSDTLEFPVSLMGGIIGSRGAKISEVRQQSGARVQVEKLEEVCRVQISGTPEQVGKARGMVRLLAEEGRSVQILAHADGGQGGGSGRGDHSSITGGGGNSVSETVMYPVAATGRIIGSRGAKISEVRQQSGAKVQIEKLEDCCQVNVTGTQEQVDLAKTLIHGLADESQSAGGRRKGKGGANDAGSMWGSIPYGVSEGPDDWPGSWAAGSSLAGGMWGLPPVPNGSDPPGAPWGGFPPGAPPEGSCGYAPGAAQFQLEDHSGIDLDEL